MKFDITTKLLLGVLATSALAALVMAVTANHRFQRDFRAYVEAGENYRIAALAETLGSIYMDTGDFSVLEAADRRWEALLRSTPRMQETGAHQPIIGTERGWPHVALYDTDDHPIVGYVGAGGDPIRHPVVVDGRTVGWIARQRYVRPTDLADVVFQRAQLWNFTIATLAAVLVAALVATMLARKFLAPARAIGATTHRLVAGDFSARVDVSSRDEFGRLADDFNLLAQTLQKNEEMRRRMMADVAHELRTPLAIIQGELAAIEDGVREASPATISSIRCEARALGKLIDDLYQLSLSDLGALAYRRQDLELRSLAMRIAGPFAERFAARNIAFHTGGIGAESLLVHADPDRLGQLLGNLLENALRYTDAPGEVELRCSQDKGHAVIEVSDSPPGVPEEELALLFERFYRGEESRNRALGGAGLGLAICRNIVEAHGGTIDASPSALGGVTIRVRLPLLRSTA